MGKVSLKLDSSDSPLLGGTWDTPLLSLPVVVLFNSRETEQKHIKSH